MRKFLPLLLSILGFTSLNSQNTLLKAKREYTRNNATEVFKIKSQQIWAYDSKICLDTLISTEVYGSDFIGQYRNDTKVQKRYDSQKRLISSVKTQAAFSKTTATTNGFTQTGSVTERNRYVYTAPVVRADTMFSDNYDATTKSWNLAQPNLMRKAGFGYDTLRGTGFFTVYDNKGRLIIDKYLRNGKNTSDSTVYTFDANDKLVSYEIFNDNYGFSDFSCVYKMVNQYQNGNLSKSVSSVMGTENTTTVTDFYYKNGVPDYEETFTKKVTKIENGRVVADSTKERVRYVSFNTANKCLEKVFEQWVNARNTWQNMGGNKMVYQNDTLLLRDTFIFNGQQNLTVYEYGACNELVFRTEFKKKFNFTTAPNPAIHGFSVTLGDEFLKADAQMLMYNVQGNIILSRTLAAPSEMIDVSGFARGLYFVKIVQGEKAAVQKVVLH
jgi:Secretion system C-terminal sorting domain